MTKAETASAETSKLEEMYHVAVKRRVILTDLTLRLRADLDRLLGSLEITDSTEDEDYEKSLVGCGTIYALQDEAGELSNAIEQLGLQLARLHAL